MAQYSCEFDANQLLNREHRTESAHRLEPLITCPKRDLAFLTQFPSLKRRHGKKRKENSSWKTGKCTCVVQRLSYWSTMKTSLLLHIFHSWLALMMLLLLQPVHLTERADSTLADCTVSNQQDHRKNACSDPTTELF